MPLGSIKRPGSWGIKVSIQRQVKGWPESVVRSQGEKRGCCTDRSIQEGTAWGLTSQGNFGSQAGVAGRTDPAFAIEGLFLRWTFIEPLLYVRLRPRLCEHPNGKNKQIGQRLGTQVLTQGCLCLRPALPLPDLWFNPEQVYNLGPWLPHA